MTSPNPIPEECRDLIVEYIDSVPALEALLVMRRLPDRAWTLSTLAAELYTDPRRLAPILTDLSARGLCGSPGDGGEAQYTALPASTELARRIDALAAVYAHNLVAVTNLIHSKPRASVRGFSDAFRLRGGE